MAIFDELGERITEAGKTVLQKTRDTTESVRLKALIREEERKIRQQYEAMGALYAEIHGNDPEYRFAEAMSNVRASTARIAEYRAQITALQGAEECPYCGAAVPPDGQFCTVCGKKLGTTVQEESASAYCPKCGAAVKSDAVFCKSCGEKL